MTIFDKFVSERLVDFLGTTDTGVDDAPNSVKSDEKNPLAWFIPVFKVSV